jgi:cytidylate kinase
MDNKRLTIAIDGYSACGKSTLAKDLAKMLDYIFIDSGAMYRGVTLYALKNNLIENSLVLKERLVDSLSQINLEFKKNKATEKNHLFVNGIDVEEQIRVPEIAALVSKIATIKEVREKLVAEQREMGKNGGVVMDGRDIGSVVFPNAELKLFVTAEPRIRAQRRLKEMTEKGIKTNLDEVLSNLLERDEMDRTRKESPLIQTEDAILIDTSHFTREGQVEFVLDLIKEKFVI